MYRPSQFCLFIQNLKNDRIKPPILPPIQFDSRVKFLIKCIKLLEHTTLYKHSFFATLTNPSNRISCKFFLLNSTENVNRIFLIVWTLVPELVWSWLYERESAVSAFRCCIIDNIHICFDEWKKSSWINRSVFAKEPAINLSSKHCQISQPRESTHRWHSMAAFWIRFSSQSLLA